MTPEQIEKCLLAISQRIEGMISAQKDLAAEVQTILNRVEKLEGRRYHVHLNEIE